MPIVKRTFSLPDKVSNLLDESVPNQERSKFISSLITNALERLSRQNLCKTIDGIEFGDKQEESIIDVIRRIRIKK